MKIRQRNYLHSSLGILAVLTAVASLVSQRDPVAAEAADPLQVVTTILPITNFTQAVAGDRAEVISLMPTNVGPHDFQARPQDAQALAKADVLVMNGLGIEEFLAGLIDNAGNPDLQLIDSSAGIPTIATVAAAEGDEHAGEGEHEQEHGVFNPHIWLDPKRAMQQVETIRDGLIAADPEGKAIYTENAAAYLEKLKALDVEVTTALQPYAGKTFVTYHDFAPYFAESYHLKAEFLVGVPDENPSPEDVKRIIEAVQKSGLKTLLTELQAGEDNPFQAIAKDLNVSVSVFDPLETGPAEAHQPQYYLTVMRQNVANLQTAFSGQAVSLVGSSVLSPPPVQSRSDCCSE
jgi:zinc/manganese transport system substrate-binding protein